MESFDNTQMISGPVNLVRVEGKVGNIKKVMYIYFDIHMHDTKCKDDFTLNIDQYLIREFSRLQGSDTVYDFYEEIPLSHINLPRLRNGISKNSRNYLEDIALSFLSKIDYESISKDDVMKLVRYNSNLRLHLIDIRQEFVSRYITDAYKIIVKLINLQYDSVIMMIKDIKRDFKLLIDIYELSKKSDSNEKITFTTFIKQVLEDIPDNDNQIKFLSRMMWKLYHVYKHEDIKEKISELMDDLYNQLIQICKDIDSLEEFVTTLNEDVNPNKHLNYICSLEINGYCITYHLKKIIDKIDDYELLILNIADNLSAIIDLYTIRRFLDKDYTSNGIFYGGAFHSNDIIYYLVKYFGFKVTHYAHGYEITDLDYINSFIRDVKNVGELKQIFYQSLDNQCIDMSKFPKDFK